MTVQSPDRTAVLEAKIDALTEQVAQVAAEAREQRMRRESWDELRLDVTPLLGQAMESAGRQLEDVQEFTSVDDLVRLLKRILRNVNRIEETFGRFESALEFLDDVGTLGDEAFVKALRSLETFEQRGYFSFAKAGFDVVDRVVTTYGEDDVKALGDNVVTMLDTVKEITQPDMLALLQRMIDALQAQQLAIEQEDGDPPSLFALVRKMRDPNVRRGINRALDTLGSVTAETSAATVHEIQEMKQKGAL
jgi:uncharacterized protein YjgD (DUF1641 family)/CRISPR/Cas system CSM-associated protein Csm2 small subunit